MAASNQTPKGFPQWEGTDRLAIRGDLNAAFAAIDDELVQTDGKIATLENEGSSLRATVADVNTRLGIATSTLDSVGDTVANTVSTLDDVSYTVANINTQLGAAVSTLDSVGDTVDIHDAQIVSLNTAVTDINERDVNADTFVGQIPQHFMRYWPGQTPGIPSAGFDANTVNRKWPSMIPISAGVNTPNQSIAVLETIPYTDAWVTQYFHEMNATGGALWRRSYHSGNTWSQWAKIS